MNALAASQEQRGRVRRTGKRMGAFHRPRRTVSAGSLSAAQVGALPGNRQVPIPGHQEANIMYRFRFTMLIPS